MKIWTLCIALFVGSSVFAQDKPATEVTTTADHIVLNGPNVELTGNVVIKNADFTMQADEAIHHGDTGEIEAHGNVRLKSAKGDVNAANLKVLIRSGDIRVLVIGSQTK